MSTTQDTGTARYTVELDVDAGRYVVRDQADERAPVVYTDWEQYKAEQEATRLEAEHKAEQAAIEERVAFTAGLRELADFFDATPAAWLPTSIDLRRHCMTREDLVQAASALGDIRQDFSGRFAEISRSFGPITITYQASREQVCTPRIEDGKVVWDAPAGLVGQEA